METIEIQADTFGKKGEVEGKASKINQSENKKYAQNYSTVGLYGKKKMVNSNR